jgi:hypothetical protein
MLSFDVIEGSVPLLVKQSYLTELVNGQMKKSFHMYLQSMKHALAQQGKTRSSIAHPFNQFELVHFSLN